MKQNNVKYSDIGQLKFNGLDASIFHYIVNIKLQPFLK